MVKTLPKTAQRIKSIRKVIRVRTEDSAFVYFILESYEGITSYSTLDFQPGDPYRDLELRIPPDFIEETRNMLSRLEIGFF
ncbi:MAG: hypothetical protein AABZ06_03865 [Bdellovibrionota bacterium]